MNTMKPIRKLKRCLLAVLFLLSTLPAWCDGVISDDLGKFEGAHSNHTSFNVSEMNPERQFIDVYFSVTGRLKVSYRFNPDLSNTYPPQYCNLSLYEVKGDMIRKYPILPRSWEADNSSDMLYISYLDSGRYIFRIEVTPDYYLFQNTYFWFAIISGNLNPDIPLDEFTNIPLDEFTEVPFNKPINIPLDGLDSLSHGSEPDYGSEPASGLTATRSYLISRQMLSADGTSKLETVSYTDGLGRPIQTVRRGFTPNGADLVDFTDYDWYGSAWRQWKPVPIAGRNGAFINNLPLKAGELCQDTRPYSEMDYAAFHPDKPIFTTAPGNAWKEHPAASFPMTNTRHIPVLNCTRYSISSSGVPVKEGFWTGGELSVTRFKNENENEGSTFTFADKLGRVLLERRMCDTVSYNTYYVYDSQGDLRYVLPPAMNGDVSPALLEQFAYSYEYDALHRLTGKKFPGCSAQKYVYDPADRIIFSRDGKQASSNEWTFSIPDSYGREAIRGICRMNWPPDMASAVKATFSGSSGNAVTGYSLSGVSLTPESLLTVNYYDSYDFLQLPKLSACANALAYKFVEGYDSRYVNASAPASSAYGKLTGSSVFVPETNMEIVTAYYYDDRGNVVQSRSTNHLGGYDTNCFAYTFAGDVKTRMHTQSAIGKTERKEVYRYTYDHGNRLVSATHKLDGNPEVRMLEHTYDEFCRLSGTKMHNGVDITNYAYNIRDWMTAITGGKFEQKIHYTDGPGTPCYNGNISGMTWKTGDTERGYKFTYDSMSRLVNAEYGEGSNLSLNPNRFNEQVTGYDKMGNILGLKRSGQTAANVYGLIDNLSLSYTGNRLKTVSDNTAGSAYGDGFEFKDGAKAVTEYEYDVNGNLTKDLNKKIADIQYNVLNLPSRILFQDGNSIAYLYDANGAKLRTTHMIGNDTTTTDYCGNVIYENGNSTRLLTEAGYVSLNDNKYHYFIQDHQGNNRVVVDQNGTVEEVNHYYPFGGVFASSQAVQPYKYNGKELDTKNGLDWYDYGARMYDPAVGRWHAVDPLSELSFFSSTYGYCKNNPTNRIDIGGKWDITVHAHNNRESFGYGFLIVTDKSGNAVYSTTVRLEGSNSKENNYNKRNRTKTFADTPTGQYNIKGWSKRLSKKNKGAYGSNAVLELDYTSGEAAGLRNGIHLHGGRQEGKGGKGKGSTLKVTQGCLRIYDEDIAEMKMITDLLEKNDSEEKGNTLNVINDLNRIDNGPHPRPFDYPKQENKQDDNAWDIMYRFLRENPSIKFTIN